MIGIIDYGVGNLFSLESSLKYIGEEVIITKDKELIKKCQKLILPGVGAFKDAENKLKESGLTSVILDEVAKGKDILGICLGMQMLFQRSYEYGEYKGLGLLKGEVVPMEGHINENYKVPHIGWNQLRVTTKDEETWNHSLLKYIKDGDYVYFVHSYFATGCEESLIATTEYDKSITAMVGKDNIMGCQFHPEKSGDVGLNILRGFCERR